MSMHRIPDALKLYNAYTHAQIRIHSASDTNNKPFTNYAAIRNRVAAAAWFIILACGIADGGLELLVMGWDDGCVCDMCAHVLRTIGVCAL